MVLTILIVIMASAVPSVSSMIDSSQSRASVNRLVTAVNFTRHSAVQYQTTATLCGLKQDGRCGASWATVLTVFLDRNINARFDGGDEVITRIQPLGTNNTVKWRSFRNRQYLQMTGMGHTRHQNGNFVVCLEDADPKAARQIVINVQGRVRVNHALNDEGYPIDRNGKVLKC